MNIIYEKIIKLPEGGLKTFKVKVVSDKDVKAVLKFYGVKIVCYNCEGKDYLGNDFAKAVDLISGKEQNFWCTANSVGSGFFTLSAENGKVLFKGDITVERADCVTDDPFADGESLNKIAWLNSDLAIDDKITKPYIPVKTNGNTVEILGRIIGFSKFGLPEQITSYFNEGVKICEKPTRLLSAPIEFSVVNEKFENRSFNIENHIDKAIIRSLNEGKNFDLRVEASSEFDGFTGFKLSLVCKNDVEISDARLRLPFNADRLKYFIGLGKKGGLFDKTLDKKWNENVNQDGFWAGSVNVGLKIRFKGENYVKPFVNIYYNHRKLNKPESWDNDGKGGIKFENGEFVAYCGRRTVKKGEVLHFDFDALITPLKEIDLKKQFGARYYHSMYDSDKWLDRAKTGGANIINVHHGNDLNPYINYPFTEIAALKDFTEKAHENGILVKPYYTIRELTVNAPEFKVFRDLGYEIIAKRNPNEESRLWQGEAKEWIVKNVGDDVIPAWRQPLKGSKYKNTFDSAVITEGQSRLCNFYVEGLNYLVEKADIDGIYIDDVAYDRNIMKRVRKVLDKKPTAYIDFHQWNCFADIGGNGNCAVQYAELYPFVDKCWIGEGFDYDESAEFWLIETSGIPFGVMSEMMDSGNEYRGLTFGETNRLGWETNESNPFCVWRIFDDYHLADGEMIGWWDGRNSIKLSNPSIRATEFIVGEKRYIAVANFSDKEQESEILIDGLSVHSLYAPRIDGFQTEKNITGKIVLSGGSGLFIEVSHE